MSEIEPLFNLLLGWMFVAVAVLLLFVILMVIRSSNAFKNAKIVKGKIVELNQFADEHLPTIEFVEEGKVKRFRETTKQEGLQIGKEVKVQLGRSNDVRLFEEGKVDKLPKMVFVVMLIFMFFFVKAILFLKTFFVL